VLAEGGRASCSSPEGAGARAVGGELHTDLVEAALV
jgi:hypothetical protein